jgi:small subunit ribosomal protein S9
MERYAGVGRRKTAVARVYLTAGGAGEVLVNKRPVGAYFMRETLKTLALEPLSVTENEGKFTITANVRGGGLTGQAGAVRLGIARALVEMNPELRSVLRKYGLLTRDPRMVERKKYGQPGAR